MDELARTAFDACRLPLALVTPQGVIVAANPAFARFVMGVSVEVEGLPVRSTPLATAWSTAEQDLARTLAGNPVRRIIEIDVAEGEVRRLLLWLDAVSREHVVLGRRDGVGGCDWGGHRAPSWQVSAQPAGSL